MKKLFLGIVLVAMFVSTVLFASVPISKKHKGKVNDNGVKVNCVYCHKTVGVPKEKGKIAEFQPKPTCHKMACHGK